MAVAVKSSPETTTSTPVDRLPVWSLLGTLYILAAIGVIFYVYPFLWDRFSGAANLAEGAGSFVDFALKYLGLIALACGFGFVGNRLLGSHPPHGLKAGIFVGLVGIALVALLTWGTAALVEALVPSTVGMAITVLVGGALCFLLATRFVKPGFERTLIRFEDQGWFTAAGYKKSQGRLVRRGTIVGILILAASGIYTFQKTLGTGANNHWVVRIPFTTSPEVPKGVGLVILPDKHFSVPLLLAAASIWLAYRVVNYPVFADFLVATEAELNKVSWTTRKRLFQDTIVVLTTVVLLTVFLFLVDALWSWSLSSRWIGVLNVSTSDKKESKDSSW